MADVTFTAALLIADPTAETGTGIAGATIAIGDVLYKDAADSNKLKLTDSNAAGALTTAVAVGIALNGNAAGQPVSYVSSGLLACDGLTAGKVYVVSGTAGKVAPSTDLVTGWYVTVLGVALSATSLKLSIIASKIATP